MDNKEIALKLTIAAMETGIIDVPEELPTELRSEPIKDFYLSMLEGLNLHEEE